MRSMHAAKEGFGVSLSSRHDNLGIAFLRGQDPGRMLWHLCSHSSGHHQRVSYQENNQRGAGGLCRRQHHLCRASDDTQGNLWMHGLQSCFIFWGHDMMVCSQSRPEHGLTKQTYLEAVLAGMDAFSGDPWIFQVFSMPSQPNVRLLVDQLSGLYLVLLVCTLDSALRIILN